MKKPEPVCPKCGSDQRKAPKKPSVKAPKPPVVEEYEQEEGGIMVPLEEIEPLDFQEEDEEGGEGFRPTPGARERHMIDDLPDEDF